MNYANTAGVNLPPPDAICEVQIQTQQFDSKYGNSVESQAVVRWSAIEADQLYIHQAVRRVKKGQDKIGVPKTRGSKGFVYLTKSLPTKLLHWKPVIQPTPTKTIF